MKKMEGSDSRTAMKHLLRIPANRHCIHCLASPVEYVSINNAIFVCSLCARSHHQLPAVSSITSVLSTLTREDLDLLLLGGNEQFGEFMGGYVLQSIKDTLESTAADYYRRMLRATALGEPFEEERPSLVEGAEPIDRSIFKSILDASLEAVSFISSMVRESLCRGRPSVNELRYDCKPEYSRNTADATRRENLAN